MRIFQRFVIPLLVQAVVGSVVLADGLSREPGELWHPFPPAVFTDHYTAGPFAITTNMREDNPIWEELAGFNLAQARMSYVGMLGSPAIQLAWLLPEAEWKDEPVLPNGEIILNTLETQISRELVAAGLIYDRVSRRDLAAATGGNGVLAVGHARYEGLLVSGLDSVAPQLLESIVKLAERGIPVVWLGDFPERATGWARHEERDSEVHFLVEKARQSVTQPAQGQSLKEAFFAHGIRAALAPADSSPMRLRTYRRQAGQEHYFFLFNETDQPVGGRYIVQGVHSGASLLNPEDGSSRELAVVQRDGFVELEINLPAKRTQILRLAGATRSGAEQEWDAELWQKPGREYYPFIRWWWPGNAVEEDELRRELRSLHTAGFGGVELQTLTLGFRFEELRSLEDQIYQVGTPAFFENLLVVFEEARKLDMTVDLTLGSGWSGGGPFIEQHPVQQLIHSWFDVEGPAELDVVLPEPMETAYVEKTNAVIADAVGAFDHQARLLHVLAGRIDTSSEPHSLSEMRDIGEAQASGRLSWSVPEGWHRIFTVYQNASSQNAVGSAYPGALASSPIFDHLGRGGIDEYIEKLGEPWLQALAPFKPNAVFVDSFELIAELPWSDGFLDSFREMHGYDLTPWLPLVFKDFGESKYLSSFVEPNLVHHATDVRGERIREDYEATREALFREAFLLPLKGWTTSKGVKLRMQAHGGYGDYLDSYQIADIPEAEDLFAGGSFDFLKLASSAAHVAGRRVASTEAFIKLASDLNTLDLDDYHLLAGNAFAAGINRTVAHGYAYHFPLYSRDTKD